MSRSQLTKYLGGESVPSLRQADKIANALGTNLGAILSGHSEMDCLRTTRHLLDAAESDPERVKERLDFLFSKKK